MSEANANDGKTSIEVEASEAVVAPKVEPSADDATLPPVPEGAILSKATGIDPSGDEATESPSEGEAPAIRLVGEGGSELDFLPEEQQLDFPGVVLALVDAALDAGKAGGKPLNGKAVAEIFCRGDVEDPRVEFLLLLLAQDRPIDHELVLAAARATESLGELVEEAVATREELERAGDVSVEQLGAAGAFVPMARALAEAGA